MVRLPSLQADTWLIIQVQPAQKQAQCYRSNLHKHDVTGPTCTDTSSVTDPTCTDTGSVIGPTSTHTGTVSQVQPAQTVCYSLTGLTPAHAVLHVQPWHKKCYMCNLQVQTPHMQCYRCNTCLDKVMQVHRPTLTHSQINGSNPSTDKVIQVQPLDRHSVTGTTPSNRHSLRLNLSRVSSLRCPMVKPFTEMFTHGDTYSKFLIYRNLHHINKHITDA